MNAVFPCPRLVPTPLDQLQRLHNCQSMGARQRASCPVRTWAEVICSKGKSSKKINERAPTVSPPLELLLQVVNRFLSKIKALVMSLLRVLGLLARGFEASSQGVFSECLSLMPLDTRALLSIAQFCPVATHSNSLAAQKAFSLEHHLKREVC